MLSRRAVSAGLVSAAVAGCGEASTLPAVAAAPGQGGGRPGLDAALLAQGVDAARALPQLRSLIVARHGRSAFEQAFRGPGLDRPVNIKSASKTVLASVAGAAIARGELALDQPVAPILGRRVPAAADRRVRTITVEHLLAMAAGLEPTSGRNYGAWVSSRDWVGYALTRPFVDRPGGRMLYSTGTSHILSAVLTAATGRSTLELTRAWLGQPLDVEVPAWTRDPQGIYFGGNEMALSPRALLRFGEMHRNDGLHAGARILPADFVRDAWVSRGGRSPWTGYTYGLGWWIRESAGHPVYFAWGYGGQMVYVVPSLALTVVMTSDPAARGVTGHVQALHTLFDQALVPAAARGA
ncbi:serine hydrolase [Phenylobacterium sp.]|jgi:CubicO group peptidase (beta-lactamase class C family)|uniref:serine hydrolase domain-containing protein n=1 Tax=Phenylobacterium sp. TaxID=1871053 RepID=UPI002F94D452